MSEDFDPYYKWLGIPAQEQPPNHYRLLAIRLFEEDPQVIESAADRQMVYLRTLQTGQHVRHAQKLLNEIAQARVNLLKASKKADYDAALQRQLAEVVPQPASPPRVPQARPLEATPVPAPAELATQIVVVNSSASASVVPRRKPAWWWQPAMVCVGGSAALLIGVLVVWLASGKPQPVVIAPAVPRERIETPRANGASSAAPSSTSPVPAPTETVVPSPGPVDVAPQPSTPANPPVTPPSNPPPQPPTITRTTPTIISTTPGGVRFDLLRQIDLTRHRVSGNLSRDGTALTSAPNEMTVVQLPYRPNNREYVLEIVAELVDKSGPLNLGLLAGQKSFLLSLDYAGNTVLSKVDGTSYTVPHSGPGSAAIFAGGARPSIRINVRHRGLEVFSDGQLLFDWKEYGRLSANEAWLGPDQGAPTIGWNLGTFKIHKLEVTQLVGRFPTMPRPSAVVTTPSIASPASANLADLTKRRPVPPKVELEAAEQQVRSVFQKEFEKATKPDAKAELAKTLAGQAEQSRPKPAEHYSMLKLALDLAAEVGEAEAALAVLSTLSKSYEIDVASLPTTALTELGRSVKTTEARAAQSKRRWNISRPRWRTTTSR